MLKCIESWLKKRLKAKAEKAAVKKQKEKEDAEKRNQLRDWAAALSSKDGEHRC